MPDITRDVVVIGGGIIGAAITERLSRDGLSVTLVERGVVGREASRAAAGLLTPVHPWKYPPALLELDDESLTMWPELAQRLREETGADVELRRTGLLFVLENDEDEREADRRAAWKRERGERVERLTTSELLEAEPALHPEARGALLFPDLAQLRNHRVAPALCVAAARRGAHILEQTTVHGVVRTGAGVTGVRTSAGDLAAGTVVLAAGAWSGALLPAEMRATAAGTVPARGQMLLLRTTPGALRHMVLGGAGDYLVPRQDGRVLAGSTVEYAGFESVVTPAGLRGIGAAVERLAPGLAGVPVEATWAGLRPDTPDHLPAIGRVCPGLVAATGHFRSGIMLAPVTAEIVAELIADTSRRDLSAFDPLRS